MAITKNCLISRKLTTVDAFKGIYEQCKPGCIHTMYKLFQFDLTPEEIKYFTSVAPIPYEECLKPSNCQTTCVNAYRDNGIAYNIAEEAKDIAVQQTAIDASVQQSKTKTYLIVGGSLALAALLIFLASRKKKKKS